MIVEITNLTKRFGPPAGGFIAVNNISFHLHEGEILGLLGPNGAGKTTTIHMLLNLITPTSGKIKIFHKDLSSHREEILQQVNFTSPYVLLPYRLTVLENLIVFSKLYNVKNYPERIDYLLKIFDIVRLKNTAVAKLSAGENTKVGLCKALLNKPKLLLLDEPTASLDPEAALQAREILLQIRQTEKTTILYTSHNMNEIEKVCDRIVFLHHGKIHATGNPMEITQKILKEERKEPSLEEVFLKVVKEDKNE